MSLGNLRDPQELLRRSWAARYCLNCSFIASPLEFNGKRIDHKGRRGSRRLNLEVQARAAHTPTLAPTVSSGKPVGRPKSVTLAAPQYRRIQDWWHPTKNLPHGPDEFAHRTNKRIWLQCPGCPRCGRVHEWNPRAADATKTNGRNVCPACESKAGHFCSCRAVATNPRLKREWHEDNPQSPTEVSLGHQQKVKWRCQQCCHVWMANPAFRSNDGTGCPECGRSRRVRHGSIASVRPDLLREWDSRKNSLNPDHLTCGSNLLVWWKCQHCEQSWSAQVKARALNGARCPRCSQQQRFSTRQFAKDSPIYLSS